jgi:biopolymer transport protein ExbD
MAKKAIRRGNNGASLSITSLMDAMTIILVFLLKSYSTDEVTITPSGDLEVPISSAEKKPKMAVQVMVSKSAILVDAVPVLTLTTTMDPATQQEVVSVPTDELDGQLIRRLYTKLSEKAEESKRQSAMTTREDLQFKGQILLQCDRTLPFSLIREVMYTAGQAQFSEFKFVVVSQNG